ncbi:NAD-dependent epimerase/dehydratase family protein [Bradyrhizobium sp. McL0616]|uniref:NAD-dependent epimerase/dehydratase family protein n=1 Tax=Bradyrhizobium sp. McL0616 TaxID=3415674 RepID=UPI003CF98698
MRIFVTGATGFLGSYVVADLIEQGHDVAVLLRPGARSWRLSGKLDQLSVIGGSLDDLAGLTDGLRSFRPDAIVHMAWRGVSNSDRNNEDQARNVVDAVELIDLAADAGATIFVGAGSQAEYGPYDRAIVESDPPRPTTLYGIAKLASCLMAERRCAKRKLRFAWLRIFSIYGPKDNDSWLIPSLIRTLRANGHMALTGCEQRWGFLHVRDAAAAVRLVLANPGAEGLYNLGCPEAPPLRETVTRLRDLIGAGDLGFGEVLYRPDQVMVLAAGVKRLEGLGWRPSVEFEQGLRETVAWSQTTDAGDK